MDDLFDQTYAQGGRAITMLVVFVIVWIACMAAGGVLGFMLGWMPAWILGQVAYAIAPLLWYGALLAFAAFMVLVNNGS